MKWLVFLFLLIGCQVSSDLNNLNDRLKKVNSDLEDILHRLRYVNCVLDLFENYISHSTSLSEGKLEMTYNAWNRACLYNMQWVDCQYLSKDDVISYIEWECQE